MRKLNERKMPNAFEHAKNAFANADGVLGMATWFRAYGLALLDAAQATIVCGHACIDCPCVERQREAINRLKVQL